ncbi:MAG: F0F1 ATP synthase subunit B [Bacteroidales bacterium]|jgi:F-type H+-transporting ATPase subunit b|nr:F0F1 ATP synthase subunit B [Bacteroidales bacterium]
MELLTPDMGIIFWSSLTFLILLLILRRYAWKPILQAIKSREDSIQEALDSAKLAKEQFSKLQEGNKEIIKEAKAQKDSILKEARDIKDQIIKEAKEQADAEAAKMRKSAAQDIDSMKKEAIVDIKKEVASLSVDIAEKILKKDLENSEEQKRMIESFVDDIKIN